MDKIHAPSGIRTHEPMCPQMGTVVREQRAWLTAHVVKLTLSRRLNTVHSVHRNDIRGCIRKFQDWPPGARTAKGTVLCHWVQLYRYFVSQSTEFCHHNPLCCFSMSVYCCYSFRYRLSPETYGYPSY
jgi:hypothetical protein